MVLILYSVKVFFFFLSVRDGYEKLREISESRTLEAAFAMGRAETRTAMPKQVHTHL